MEWYYIAGIIVGSLSGVAYIVNRVNNLVRDNKETKKDVDALKIQMEKISKSYDDREITINEIKSDIKLINQKFDIYIKQLSEIIDKQDKRLDALERHTSSCLFANKKVAEIKEILNNR